MAFLAPIIPVLTAVTAVAGAVTGIMAATSGGGKSQTAYAAPVPSAADAAAEAQKKEIARRRSILASGGQTIGTSAQGAVLTGQQMGKKTLGGA